MVILKLNIVLTFQPSPEQHTFPWEQSRILSYSPSCLGCLSHSLPWDSTRSPPPVYLHHSTYVLSTQSDPQRPMKSAAQMNHIKLRGLHGRLHCTHTCTVHHTYSSYLSHLLLSVIITASITFDCIFPLFRQYTSESLLCRQGSGSISAKCHYP